MTTTRTPELDTRRAPASRRRDPGTASGWITKIVLLGLVDALAVTGLLIAWEQEAWGYVGVLAVTLVALNVVYLPRRYVPMKFLLPGLFFLAVFGIYPVLYTAYASTTNYGTGFVLSRSQAIDQIQSQSIGRVEGAVAYDVTPLAAPDGTFAGYGLFDPETEELFLGTTDGLEPLDEPAELQVLTTTGRTFVVRVGDLAGVRPGDLDTLPGYPADPEAYVIPGESEDTFIGISGGQAFESRSTRVYDPDAGTITDTETGTVYTEQEGQFVSADGDGLFPGFTAGVGFDNYREVLTGSEFRGDFPRVLSWTIAFALLSVLDHVRSRPGAGDGVQRTAHARPQDLSLAADHPVRTAGIHDGPRLPRPVQPYVRHQQVVGHRRRLAGDARTGDVLAGPAQPLARLPVHVPRVDGCPAEHPDRPQGGRLRRRRHRVDDVPQGDLPAAAHRGEPTA